MRRRGKFTIGKEGEDRKGRRSNRGRSKGSIEAVRGKRRESMGGEVK